MEARKIIRLSVFFALFVSLAPISIQAAVPNAITDLQCSYSGTPGNIQLSWTVPSGNLTGYELRYDLLDITETNFNDASPFNYGWTGAENSLLVSGFAQNKYWYFALRATNADGASALSNVVHCQANTMAGVNAVTYPSSTISNLSSGSEIKTGGDFLVEGTSSDQGGSSVKKVEISFDNGSTWATVSPTRQVGTGFEWQYRWVSPEAGDYSIKTRAIDWLDAQENQTSSLAVKVVEQQSGSEAAITQTSGGSQTSTSTTVSQDEQQRRNLLIQLIQLLIQLLSQK